jgi:hypothetical protein
MNLWSGLMVGRRNLPCIGAPLPDLPDEPVIIDPFIKPKPRGIRGRTDKYRPGMVVGTWELLRYIPGHRIPERVRGRWYCHCTCGCGVFRDVAVDTLTARGGNPTCTPRSNATQYKKGHVPVNKGHK